MRKGLSIAGAAMIAATTFVSPAYGQAQGTGPNQGGGQGNPSETSTGAPGGGGLPTQNNQEGQQGAGGGQQGGSGGQGGAGGGGGQQQVTGGGQTQTGGQATSGQPSGGPMMATGSCGQDAGMYGIYGVMPDPGFPLTDNVFYRIDYSGVPAPTTVGVIIRYNDELESQVGLTTFTAANSGGSFEGAIRSGSTNPGGQGGTNVDPLRASAGISNSRGNRDSDAIPPSTAQRRSGGGTSNTSTGGGGVQAGEYAFYVYTGEIRNMPETVKDGPAGPRFFADEKGFLGKFSCSVADN